MYRILIVEDDRTIAELLQEHLKKWDYEVRLVQDFQHVTEAFRTFDPQLVLLDILLPFFNGFYWCTEIRKLSNVPIVFLSSAADNMNIVMAMNMGGDDFIEKPFDLNVVTAKVQAILRRTYAFGGQTSILECKGIVLQLGDATVNWQGQQLELTKNEFRILKLLFEHVGKIVSRDEIMTELWESDSYIDDNTLTVNVNRLRKKLEGIGLTDVILTKKGIGYLVEK
ncbi:MAG TPA: DNA-binding response regulator [Lachnospiraceae bacterium]|nr:DNA-binding response regulator [Lachnospiraceae bacterium]